MRGSFWRSEPAAALRGLANRRIIRHVFVQLLEAFDRHVNFAAYLDPVRDLLAAQFLWDAANGAHVGRPVLADQPVSTRRADGELAVFIGQRHCQSVDFKLADICESSVGQDVQGASMPGLQFLFASRIGQAEHGNWMGMLRHILHRSASDALSGRIRRLQLWMLKLDALQFDHQPIIFCVGQRRVILDEILVVGLLDLVAQLSNVGRQQFFIIARIH